MTEALRVGVAGLGTVGAEVVRLISTVRTSWPTGRAARLP